MRDWKICWVAAGCLFLVAELSFAQSNPGSANFGGSSLPCALQGFDFGSTTTLSPYTSAEIYPISPVPLIAGSVVIPPVGTNPRTGIYSGSAIGPNVGNPGSTLSPAVGILSGAGVNPGSGINPGAGINPSSGINPGTGFLPGSGAYMGSTISPAGSSSRGALTTNPRPYQGSGFNPGSTISPKVGSAFGNPC
jgi:hypothetical protein